MSRYNVREGWMVEELRREREASSLELEELTNFVDGNEVMTERRRRMCRLRRAVAWVMRLLHVPLLFFCR